jgi:hypothetical protein
MLGSKRNREAETFTRKRRGIPDDEPVIVKLKEVVK